MANLLHRLISLLFPRGQDQDQPGSLPPPKTIVPLLIFPNVSEGVQLNETVQVGDDKYYVSSPWAVSRQKVNEAVRAAEDWLAAALITRIKWNDVRIINSDRRLSEWRSRKIEVIKDEVALLGLPWTNDYVYLAFVRGMGGYAGGIHYDTGNPGYAMVGDICLEAICRYPTPTSGSVLLGSDGWPSNSYSVTGQTGAAIHEALHGLDLPHPDGWPQPNQPGWDDTLMGNWWNMPNFQNTRGLTLMEIERVLEWTAGSK